MRRQGVTTGDVVGCFETSHEVASCYACIHCYDGQDSVKRCRVDTNGLPCSPALEADCSRYVREVGSDDSTPEWYRDAWHVAGEGRGD